MYTYISRKEFSIRYSYKKLMVITNLFNGYRFGKLYADRILLYIIVH